MSEETTTFSAARLADLIRRRELSPVEVVEAYLRRIETLNPELNAVVTLAPDAVESAREAERALVRGGAVGALHGVPLTVKDTIDVRDLRATAGSNLRKDFVPGADAPAVARLRAAGAIILGKTNCSEMALDYTAENPVFGRTLNPHDPALSPGGSSGGCAAAVAARLTAASLGSDLSGSVRIPANFCGVVALRPTVGRVPTGGHCPPVKGPYELGASLGPLARRVEDLRLLFDVLSGTPRDDARGDLSADGLRGLRFAWYADDDIVPVSEEVRAGLERAVEALRAAGLEGVEARPPGVDRATGLWMLLFSRATAVFLREAYAGRVSEAGTLAHPLVWRSSISDVDGPEPLPLALKGRERLRAELLRWMETRPLIVAPVGAVPAFRHEEVRKKVRVGEKRIGIFHCFGYAQAYNVFDLPAAAVPTGRTPGGIPLGVQIIGRPFQEDLVLAAARVVEESLGGWLPPRENLS